MSLIEVGTKTLYQADGRQASVWVREPVKGIKTYDAPQMKSGLNISQDGSGAVVSHSLGYLMNKGNNLVDGSTGVALFSATTRNAHGLSVVEGEGWRRAIALYAARKLSKETWINDKDEYLVPSVYDGEDK